MIVKICGLTRHADIAPSIEAGATHIGMIFAQRSPRSITVEDAIELRPQIPQEITAVGVFRKHPIREVIETAQAVGLTWVQLHGGFAFEDITTLHECGLSVIWATPVSVDGDYGQLPADADLLLLDTKANGQFGGSGERFAWAKTRPPQRPFLIAGGIGPDNVRQAIDAIPSSGVDMASGVEAEPGIKSHTLLRALGTALRPIHAPVTIKNTSGSASSEASS